MVCQNKTNKTVLKENLVVSGFLATTILSGFLLTLPSVSADDVVDTITITVPTSCSMSSTIATGDEHTAEIANGQSNSEIGETTIKAFCNDNEGFAIYAIGYTDNELGKNVLTNSTLGSTHDIVTGTAITGNTSQWAMKLSTIDNPTPRYPIIIAGSSEDTLKQQDDPDFSDFTNVPDDYKKVAYRIASTDVNSEGSNTAEGSTLKTTYQAYISPTQAAGEYTGQVKYTMIHPYDGVTPKKPKSLDTATTMQDVAFCSEDLREGQVYTLTDSRDNNVYHVARLADGNCWMLDNLALDPIDATTAQNMNETNTNASAEAINNLLHGGSTTTGWSSVAVENKTTGWTIASPNNAYEYPYINNASKNTTATSYGAGNGKVGVYYNYCAASASTYCYPSGQGVDVPDTIIDTPQDICPAGWRMPTGGDTGEYLAVAQKYSSTATETDSLQYNLSTPLSGYFGISSALSQGSSGFWWSSTYISSSGMYALSVNPTTVNPYGSSNRFSGLSMRCLVGE